MGLGTVKFILLAEIEVDLKLADDAVSLVATIGEFSNLVQQKLNVKHGLKPCPSPAKIKFTAELKNCSLNDLQFQNLKFIAAPVL